MRSKRRSARGGAQTGRPRLLHVATVDSTIRFMLLDQLRMFQRAGFHVTAMSAPGPWRDEIEAAGIPFIPWKRATRRWAPLQDLRAFVELLGVLRRGRFDVVHTHNPKPGVLGRIAARLAGVPVVVNTVHGLYTTGDERSLSGAIWLGAEWVAARFSDYELYQSAEDLERSRRLRIAAARRSAFLGNGIDLFRFDPARVDPAVAAAIRERQAIPDGAPVVGMVGRLVREKGWTEFFEAARAVKRAVPDAVFLAIGPRDEDKADAITPEEIEAARDVVRFCDMTLDMPEVLSLLDVFVLASHREGFPRSAIEAAAMGKPLILTDIRGCREVVEREEHGLRVPVRRPDSLAEAIKRLLSDAGLRARMGRANHARARAEFDERIIVRRTLAVYDELLQGRRVPLESHSPVAVGAQITKGVEP